MWLVADLSGQVNLAHDLYSVGAGICFHPERIDDVYSYGNYTADVKYGTTFKRHSQQFPLFITGSLHFGTEQIDDTGREEHEFVLNGGIESHFILSNSWRITAAFSTGPGFISADVGFQEPGFIFSNNLSFGLMVPVHWSGLAIRAEYRFRHMSNLNFTMPNLGIDNHFVVISIAKLSRER